MNVQSVVSRLRCKVFAQAAARTRVRNYSSRLRIEELERREVPAVLPAPLIDPQSIRNITPNSPTLNTGFSPAMAADPTNPLRLVEANVVLSRPLFILAVKIKSCT